VRPRHARRCLSRWLRCCFLDGSHCLGLPLPFPSSTGSLCQNLRQPWCLRHPRTPKQPPPPFRPPHPHPLPHTCPTVPSLQQRPQHPPGLQLRALLTWQLLRQRQRAPEVPCRHVWLCAGGSLQPAVHGLPGERRGQRQPTRRPVLRGRHSACLPHTHQQCSTFMRPRPLRPLPDSLHDGHAAPPVQVGTYSNLPGSSQCKVCAFGTFSSAPGAISCSGEA
jgi:hypothetical protein